MRSIKWALALAAAAITVLTFNAASAQGTLRIGMTAADIPLTTGQPDQGVEGLRFTGYTIYDGLINWDLSKRRQAVRPRAGPRDQLGRRRRAGKTKWIFKLRQGVKFHDGSDFNADAVVWNFEKMLKNDSRRNSIRAGQPRVARAFRRWSACKAVDNTRSRSSPSARTRRCPYQSPGS